MGIRINWLFLGAIWSGLFGPVQASDLPTVDTDEECSGRMVINPGRKDHVRQGYVNCRARGPVFDLDFQVCRVEKNGDICRQDGTGDFFYVWNAVRTDTSSTAFKVSAQNSTGANSDGLFALRYRLKFYPNPCSTGTVAAQLQCQNEQLAAIKGTTKSLMALMAEKDQMPGYGCSDPQWCMFIATNGDVYLGNPSVYGGPAMSLQPNRNVLRDQNDKGVRSFNISCSSIPAGRYCSGVDSKGHRYGGLIELSTRESEFFSLRH